MAEEREKTKQESVKLPLGTIEIIVGLKKLGIYGNTKSSVIRHFVMQGIDRVMEQNIIPNTIEAKRQLQALAKQDDD